MIVPADGKGLTVLDCFVTTIVNIRESVDHGVLYLLDPDLCVSLGGCLDRSRYFGGKVKTKHQPRQSVLSETVQILLQRISIASSECSLNSLNIAIRRSVSLD